MSKLLARQERGAVAALVEKLIATKLDQTDYGGVRAGAFHRMLINPDGQEAATTLRAKGDALAKALETIQYEAKREKGSWVHLRRCIAVQAGQALNQWKDQPKEKDNG